MSRTRQALDQAFHELKQNPPKVLAHTRKTEGKAQADKQRVAIAFSKAGLSKKACGGPVKLARGGYVGKMSGY